VVYQDRQVAHSHQDLGVLVEVSLPACVRCVPEGQPKSNLVCGSGLPYIADMSRLSRILWLISICLVLTACAGQAPFVQPLVRPVAWGSIYDAPTDSSQMENRRVWLAQENVEDCRIQVEILDSTGRVVRHFLDSLMRRKYYNLYWDCRDDQAQLVPPGEYTYRANDCGGNRDGKLRVEYQPYELEAELDVSQLVDSGLIRFVIPEDSLKVNMTVIDRRGLKLHTLITDSIMTAGPHVRKIRMVRRRMAGVKSIVKLQIENTVLHERIYVPR